MENPVSIFINWAFILVPYYASLVMCFVIVMLLFIVLVILPVFLVTTLIYYNLKGPKKGTEFTIGFFHPYCDAGGGGERVLWCGIKALKRRFPDAKFVVYTGDTHVMSDQIIDKAKDRFQIEDMEWMKDPINGIRFVYLYNRRWVEANMFPRFTLLGQSIGSIYLGWEAITKICPDVYLDTMGYAFTLPLFKIFGKCKVGCYIHYPTISTDMLNQVRSRSPTYNNRSRISNSWFLSFLKLQYYKPITTTFSFLALRLYVRRRG